MSKGISLLSRNGKFEARLKIKGNSSRAKRHSIYIGIYDTKDEAEEAKKEFILNLI